MELGCIKWMAVSIQLAIQGRGIPAFLIRLFRFCMGCAITASTCTAHGTYINHARLHLIMLLAEGGTICLLAIITRFRSVGHGTV